MSSNSDTPPDGYFNDLSRPTGSTARNKRQRSPAEEANGTIEVASGGDSTVPKPKRIACIICRKRKLKCDGSKPSCSTCTRLGHNCAYDEVRRKSGPKRGYVKALEERLSEFSQLYKWLPGIKMDTNWVILYRASRDVTENPGSISHHSGSSSDIYKYLEWCKRSRTSPNPSHRLRGTKHSQWGKR